MSYFQASIHCYVYSKNLSITLQNREVDSNWYLKQPKYCNSFSDKQTAKWKLSPIPSIFARRYRPKKITTLQSLKSQGRQKRAKVCRFLTEIFSLTMWDSLYLFHLIPKNNLIGQSLVCLFTIANHK